MDNLTNIMQFFASREEMCDTNKSLVYFGYYNTKEFQEEQIILLIGPMPMEEAKEHFMTESEELEAHGWLAMEMLRDFPCYDIPIGCDRANCIRILSYLSETIQEVYGVK